MRAETLQDAERIAQQAARTKAVRYTGHGAATGGLQGHSVGELYPLDVYGQQTPHGTRYGIADLSSGVETGPHWSVHYAAAIARSLRKFGNAELRRDVIRAIAANSRTEKVHA